MYACYIVHLCASSLHSWRSGSSTLMASLRRFNSRTQWKYVWHCKSIFLAFSNTISLSAKTRMMLMLVVCVCLPELFDWLSQFYHRVIHSIHNYITKSNAKDIFGNFIEFSTWNPNIMCQHSAIEMDIHSSVVCAFDSHEKCICHWSGDCTHLR